MPCHSLKIMKTWKFQSENIDFLLYFYSIDIYVFIEMFKGFSIVLRVFIIFDNLKNTIQVQHEFEHDSSKN